MLNGRRRQTGRNSTDINQGFVLTLQRRNARQGGSGKRRDNSDKDLWYRRSASTRSARRGIS